MYNAAYVARYSHASKGHYRNAHKNEHIKALKINYKKI